jgi:3-oxoacyl-[acyl-carrier protein] reductase
VRTVALITGASGGLGSSLAAEFARAGYAVVVNYHTNRKIAERVADAVVEDGGEALCCRADASNAAEVKSMVERAISRWGRLDVLVNNAGVTHDSLVIRMKESEWDRIMRANVKSAFVCCRAVIPQMMVQRSGHIINISSLLGVRGGKGACAYAASKAALIGLTKSLARELGDYGIRVNAVTPGFMLTPMTESLTGEVLEEERRASVVHRFSDPDSSAAFIVCLARMEAVSGQLINLDGRISRWI